LHSTATLTSAWAEAVNKTTAAPAARGLKNRMDFSLARLK
jgi:hypothetical protein